MSDHVSIAEMILEDVLPAPTKRDFRATGQGLGLGLGLGLRLGLRLGLGLGLSGLGLVSDRANG